MRLVAFKRWRRLMFEGSFESAMGVGLGAVRHTPGSSHIWAGQAWVYLHHFFHFFYMANVATGALGSKDTHPGSIGNTNFVNNPQSSFMSQRILFHSACSGDAEQAEVKFV